MNAMNAPAIAAQDQLIQIFDSNACAASPHGDIVVCALTVSGLSERMRV